MVKIQPAHVQAESKDRARRAETPGTPNGMTLDELLALPVAVDLVTAGRAWGIGRTKAHELARRGEFPCPVLRLGNAYRVTRADLLRSLGVALTEAAGNASEQTNDAGPAWASA
ncbi:hypothetical protein ACWEU6_17870 [Streptosporangium sandarakinum]|uniref:hypothetical protein n=1 Tax=Streptosporangium sandarakinum TaxID=1260955 RepID=UPI00369D96C5